MTDPAVRVALITAAGVVIAAAFTCLGIWLTQRQARAATNTTERIETQKADAAAFERAQKIYDDAIDKLNQQVDRLGAEMAKQRETHAAEMAEVKRQIDVMEMRRDADTVLIRRLQAYVRRLLAALREAGVTAPEIPEGLVLEPVE